VLGLERDRSAGRAGAARSRRSAARTELAPPGPVALWAADRDAGSVYGLDEELILAAASGAGAARAGARATTGACSCCARRGCLDVLDCGGAFLRELEVGRR
jgi:hypothetical protein